MTTFIAHSEIYFEDVTKKAGINYTGNTWSSGWIDFNNDGLPDIFSINHGNGESLLLNNGNETFSEISSTVFQKTIRGSDPHGFAWADFDNDGDNDLIILQGAKRGLGKGPNFFFVNENGLLSEESSNFGLDYPLGRGENATMARF